MPLNHLPHIVQNLPRCLATDELLHPRSPFPELQMKGTTRVGAPFTIPALGIQRLLPSDSTRRETCKDDNGSSEERMSTA